MLTKKVIDTALRLNPDLAYLSMRKTAVTAGTGLHGRGEINIFLAKNDCCSIEAVIEEDCLYLVMDSGKESMFKVSLDTAFVYFTEMQEGIWEEAVVRVYKEHNDSQARLKKELAEISNHYDNKSGGEFS